MSSYQYRDVGGNAKYFETKPGSGAGEEVPVHDLPTDLRSALLALTDISTKLTSISGYVDGLETLVTATNTALTTLQGYSDGLEGLVGTTNATLTTLNGNVDQLEGYTDGLETLVTATNTALTTLQGLVDQLEGYTDGVETKLDTLHADLSPASAFYEGTKNNGTAGTRLALAPSQALTKGVWVFAKEANTGLIYVGGSSVSSTAGGRLVAGASIWLDANNLANVYIDAAVSGEGVTYLGW